MRCYLCETEINGQSSHFSAMPYRCSRCGNLTVTDDAQMALQDYRKTYPVSKIDAISHFVRQISKSNPTKHVAVNFHNLQTWFNDPTITLKKVGEQVRYLLLWLSTAATKEGNPAKNHRASVGEIASIVGCNPTYDCVEYLLANMERENLLQGLHRDAPGSDGSYFFVRLSFKGWEQAEILRQTTRDNRLGFMAMAFNIERLEKVFDQCFKSAAKDAGFELCRLSDGQGAGLIDAQLRVRIRAAKFLLAISRPVTKARIGKLALPKAWVCQSSTCVSGRCGRMRTDRCDLILIPII